MNVLFGIIGLGVMVFVHELGHFIAAKINGVAVEVFSLGWGPKMIGFKRGGTTYQISWLPIGGYCKMKGEMVPGIAGGTGDAVPAADPTPAPGSFLAAAPWRRIVISIFGPLFNLLFAVLIFFVIWWAGFTTYTADNRIILATDFAADTFPGTPPANAGGLKTGDRIIAIDGQKTENFDDISSAITPSPGQAMAFTVQRSVGGGQQTLTLTVVPELDKQTGAARIGITAWVEPLIAKVETGSAAGIAGLHPGDRILSIDGVAVANSIEMSQALVQKPEKIDVGFLRAGQELHATVRLTYDQQGSTSLGLAFASQRYQSPRMGPLAAAGRGLEETAKTITLTVKGVGLLFRGVDLRKALAGPLRIIDFIGSTATTGFQIGIGFGLKAVFELLAFLSVSLFLMNLLPIPALDGGQIILYVVEIVRRKPARMRTIWRMQLIGFGLLITLLLYVSLNDILSLVGR